MKLDILVFAAHPDDAELSCSGTILAHIEKGLKVGIIDLTEGELGTRGSAEQRKKETKKASKLLQITVRENLGFRDGFFVNDEKHQLDIIRKIRKYKPKIVLANAVDDRHPDHSRASLLVKEACFLSGLKKIEVEEEGKKLEHWRPQNLLYYIQSKYINPSFVIDISKYWDQKIEVIKAYESQFYNPKSLQKEQTFISTPQFLNFLEARARELGQLCEVEYAEGFVTDRYFMLDSLNSLM